ncbi:MAG: glycoside hydrolase/phage tail family protein [Pseudomonadota bacterium]
MAQIALTSIGQTLGSALLPGGVGAFGIGLSGAAIGGAIGGFAGRAIDGVLFGSTREGPRIENIRIMESREGAGIPNVYGRFRVGGQVIWAARLLETRQTERVGGGKGGPRVANYTYTASFAVALCEGPINRIGRVWANGEVVALTDFNHRLYTGADDQSPDPLIEAIEGTGCVPAYRGTAYIVFEDMPLEQFGNRLPQLSFEITREAPTRPGSIAFSKLIDGVNMIPASGEFVYGTEPVRQHYFPAIETPENTHMGSARTDMLASLDQLESDLPEVRRVALTNGWFGTDLRAGVCEIRPGVETEEKETRPYSWSVGGVERGDAWLISRTADDGPSFGGTPADRAVVEGLRELVGRGFDVTISPFLFMDIPPGNQLPDPYGSFEQAEFPWRGRITASDGTAAARTEIEAFLGDARMDDFEVEDDEIRWQGDGNEWGFRRFILHHAYLAQLAGGIESFLVGSEMVGLTRIRDDQGRFPYVEGLIDLAADVRAILGPAVKISYAADWTEYGAYAPGDGSGDVLFPLDALWGDQNIDFIGVDWYPPTGDWRNGSDHLDALAGYLGPDDPDYLRFQMAGGEAFDWFYASQADRENQIRIPIIDTAHGEHWVFRQKDLIGWWSAEHYERPGGIRSLSKTDWQPGTKPIRLSELGFPAVDKGANSPNLFHDPKSSESAFPPFSTGERDDLMQRSALSAALSFWQDKTAIEATYIWAWDARPWPVFPVREDIWTDGPNWTVGHWLNGRAGLSELGRVIEDVARRGGVDIDASAVSGVIDGYSLNGVSTVRGALAPLFSTYDLILIERDGKIIVEHSRNMPIHSLDGESVLEGGLDRTRSLLDKPPGSSRLTYIDGADTYDPATVNVFNSQGDRGVVIDVGIPIVMTESRAVDLAEQLLARATEPESMTMGLGREWSCLEAGDRLRFSDLDGVWRIVDLNDTGAIEFRLERELDTGLAIPRTLEAPAVVNDPPPATPPQFILIDGPMLPGRNGQTGPLVATFGTPWARPVSVEAGASPELLGRRAVINDPVGIGRLTAPLGPGVSGRWDYGSILEIEIAEETFPSLSELAVLNGAGLLLVESQNNWELLAYREAELVASNRYRLRALLRGLRGTANRNADLNARCLIVDDRLQSVVFDAEEIGLDLIWQAEGRGGRGDASRFVFENKQALPYAPGHISHDGNQISWVRRAAEIGDTWRDVNWENVGTFDVQHLRNGTVMQADTVNEPFWRLPDTAMTGDNVEIREIGADGRAGRSASIEL